MRTLFKVLVGVAVAIAVLVAASVAVVAYFAAPFFEMADEINEMNEAMEKSGPELEAGFMAMPETQAFVQKHPEYEKRLDDFGFDYGFRLSTPDGENSLQIDLNKESGQTTITYNCTAPDGSFDAYMEDDLADRIPSMCG